MRFVAGLPPQAKASSSRPFESLSQSVGLFSLGTATLTQREAPSLWIRNGILLGIVCLAKENSKAGLGENSFKTAWEGGAQMRFCSARELPWTTNAAGHSSLRGFVCCSFLSSLPQGMEFMQSVQVPKRQPVEPGHACTDIHGYAPGRD